MTIALPGESIESRTDTERLATQRESSSRCSYSLVPPRLFHATHRGDRSARSRFENEQRSQ
jgi:hypothetical protein